MTAAPQSSSPPEARAAVRWALPLLILGVIALAFSPIFVRLSEVGPIATAVNRLALPLPLYFGLLLARRHRETHPATRDLLMICVAGFFFGGDLAVWHWSLKLTTVANSTLIANVSPAIVILLAWLLFDERVGRMFLIGGLTALAGVALLASRNLEAAGSRGLLGDALALGAALFYAGYLLTAARMRRRASALSTMAYSGLAACVILVPLALATEGTLWPHTSHGWIVAFGLAIVSQSIGQMLLVFALAHVPTGLGALMLLLQPAIATVLAWSLFGETLLPLQMIGGVAVLAGLWLARRGSAPQTA